MYKNITIGIAFFCGSAEGLMVIDVTFTNGITFCGGGGRASGTIFVGVGFSGITFLWGGV